MTRLSKKAGITTMGKKSAKKKEKPGARADAHGRGKVATSGKKKKQPAVLTEEQIKMITQRRKITKAILEKQKSLEKEREKKKKEKEKEKKKVGHPAAIKDLFSEKKRPRRRINTRRRPGEKGKREKREGKRGNSPGLLGEVGGLCPAAA